jgi:hypothetical protein
LTAVLAALVVAVAGGTVWALWTRGAAADTGAAAAVTAAADSGEATRMFTGIGRLRIPLAPNTAASNGAASNGTVTAGGATAVVTIVFPYNPLDRAFSGELASRLRDFRAEARNCFAALPPSQLANEAAIKAELLRRYNSLLRLGSISAIYFSEYMIIE